MTKSYFISEENLKEFSLLDDNLSFDYIKPTLQFVQDKYMNLILGFELYVEIDNQIFNGSVSNANKTLLNDYLKYVILWGLMAEIQIPLNYKFRNAGYVQNNNEDNGNVYLNEIKYTKQFYLNTTEFYVDATKEFLRKNRADYPKYKCINNNDWNCPIVL